MFGSSMLDIAVGVVFTFLLLSIFATAINEIIASILAKRGTMLLEGITALLDDNAGLVSALYNSGQVCGLYKGPFDGNKSKNLPSYIPARNFALALIECVEQASGAPVNTPATEERAVNPADGAIVQRVVTINDAFKAGAAQLAVASPKVGKPLLSLINNADNDFVKARTGIEDWFNSAMDRASGRYKKHTQTNLFFIGILMAIALNANTINIVHQISINQPLRDSLVAQAKNAKLPANTNGEVDANLAAAKTAFTNLDGIGVPLGWPRGGHPETSRFDRFSAACAWVFATPSMLLGWLFTAIAVSVGAPFWFDALNKIMVIRSTVKPAEKSPPEKSNPENPHHRLPSSQADGGGD